MVQTTFSKTFPLRKIFQGSRFTIPEIQRDFAWEAKKEVSKLLEDLWKYHTVTNKDSHPEYFIGTIIVYRGNDGDDLQIMDGQQRISSLTCLMSAIKSHIERKATQTGSKRAQNIAEKIEDDFLFEIVKKKPVCKLQPKTNDALSAVKKMVQMDGKSPKETFAEESKEISGHKIFKALDYFYIQLFKLASDQNPDDPIGEIINFYRTVANKIVATLTTTTTMGMAFQMFVSVNGQGKPLNSYDLFRGLMVAKSHSIGLDEKVSTELRELNKIMKKLEKKLKVDHCVRYWVESRKGENIQKVDVPDHLEIEIRGFSDFAQFKEMSRELNRFAVAYLSLCDTTSPWFKDTDLYPAGHMENKRILGFSPKGGSWQAQHTLLYAALHSQGPKLNNQLSNNQITQVMEATEWINIRGGWSDIPNKMEKIYPQFANKALYEFNDFDEWIEEYIETLDNVISKVVIEGFNHLKETKVTESEATVLLHKVSGSGKDPGPRMKTENCNGCMYLPTGSPPPWNVQPERDDHGSVSALLGNWFLMKDIGDSQILKFPQPPGSRLEAMLKNANTKMMTMTLSEIKKNLNKEKKIWNSVNIISRTTELQILLEKAWPREYKRSK